MKKALVGIVAVGAAIGLRPALRHAAHKMREHCEQMPAHCRGCGEAVGRP